MEEITSRSGIPAVEARKATHRLIHGGLVHIDSEGRYTADPDVFKTAVRIAADRETAAPLHPDPNRDALLQAVLRNGRLRRLPTAPGKTLAVLEYLIGDFKLGERYPESEVNAILQRRYDDHATLRRYLVDYGLLDRANGKYWRVT